MCPVRLRRAVYYCALNDRFETPQNQMQQAFSVPDILLS